MQIYEIVKNTMEKHKSRIELLQWATMNSVAALVYSEYLRNIRQKLQPVKQVLVPSIKTLTDFMNPDGNFMQRLSKELIEKMAENEKFKKFSHAPELVLFQEENIEVLKTVFDLYILRNVSRRLPESINKKFALDDPNQQIIREDRELMLFNYQPITDDHFNFIVEETVLQLLLLMPTMIKQVYIPERNIALPMSEDEIMTVANDHVLAPVHFSKEIIENDGVIEMLKFVTATTIDTYDPNGVLNAILSRSNKKDPVRWVVRTDIFNEVSFTELIRISTDI